MKTIGFERRLVIGVAVLFIGVFAASGDSVADLQRGLISYWSFDEGQGSIAHDYSGNGHHGTIHGASWTAGISGSALDFDGINDWVRANPIYLDEHTINVWLNGRSFPRVERFVLMENSRTQDRTADYAVYITHDSDKNYPSYFLRDSGGQPHFVSLESHLIDTNTWYMITASYDGYRARLYLNGQPIAQDSFTIDIREEGDLLGIADDDSGGEPPFNGIIDEVRIYNRALDPGEVLGLYHSPGPSTYNWTTRETVGSWSLNECAGDTAHDESPYGNDGECIETVWTDGKSGCGLSFGTELSSRVRVPDDPSLDFDDLGYEEGFKIDFWMQKMATPGPYFGGLVCKQTYDGGYYVILNTDNKITFLIGDGQTWHSLTARSGIYDHMWHHIVALWDGATMYLYIDEMAYPNSSIEVGSFRIGDTFSCLTIGNHWPQDWENPFTGKIDEVQISVVTPSGGKVRPRAVIDSIGPSPAWVGEEVTFCGHGTDQDGSIVGYNWRSSIDGQLSTDSSFSTSSLHVGPHLIYFKVQDDDGDWSTEAARWLIVKEYEGVVFSYPYNTSCYKQHYVLGIADYATGGNEGSGSIAAYSTSLLGGSCAQVGHVISFNVDSQRQITVDATVTTFGGVLEFGPFGTWGGTDLVCMVDYSPNRTMLKPIDNPWTWEHFVMLVFDFAAMYFGGEIKDLKTAVIMFNTIKNGYQLGQFLLNFPHRTDHVSYSFTANPGFHTVMVGARATTSGVGSWCYASRCGQVDSIVVWGIDSTDVVFVGPEALAKSGEVVEAPSQFSLTQNYPNPFNSSTTIKYGLPQASDVTIQIYDLLGHTVETLIHQQQPAGYHQITWDAKDKSSGIYFYKIQAGEYTATRRMMLVK